MSSGFWMGGGLDGIGCGDGGRCFAVPGEGGRILGLCLAFAGEGVLLGDGLGAGEGERFRVKVDVGEAGR